MKNVVCFGSEFVFSVQVKKHSKTIKYFWKNVTLYLRL